MHRKLLTLMSILLLVLAAGPVAAHDFTGSEEEQQELDCPAEGEEVPPNQEPPDYEAGDCPGEEDDETYEGYVWDNQVTCNDDEAADLEIGKLYVHGDDSDLSGGVGVCNDGDTGPLQGRIVIQGSMEDEGIAAYADGTDENEPDQLQGWARVDVGTSGAEARCGADDGKRDATHPGEDDTMDNCG